MDLFTLVDRSPATKRRADRPVNFAHISSLLDNIEQFRVNAFNVGQDPFKIPASAGDIKLVDRSILAFTLENGHRLAFFSQMRCDGRTFVGSDNSDDRHSEGQSALHHDPHHVAGGKSECIK